MHDSRKARAAFLAAAVSFASTLSTSAFARTDGTWIADVGTAGGNWTNPANWFNGVVPDGGGVATFVEPPTFTTAPLAPRVDTNISLSKIVFDSFITYTISPPTAGPSGVITLTGAGEVQGVNQSFAATGSSFFGHTITAPIAGSVGLTKTGPGILSLQTSSNTYSGNININDGVLIARQFGDAVFGNPANQINFNGGTLRIGTGAMSSGRTFNLLAGGGTIDNASSASTSAGTFTGSITGAGNLAKTGGATVAFAAAMNYTGSTTVYAGTLLLNSNGAITGSSAFTSRSTVIVDNTTTNSSDRLRDAMPITMQGIMFNYVGNATANSSETIGATTFDRGTTQITLTPGAAVNATLTTTGAAARANGGGLFVRGNGLGSGAGSSLVFGTAPTLVGGGGAAGTTNISVIPWAYGATSSAAATGANTNSLVTYGANGVRPLDTTTEYAATFAAAAATDNVRITASDTPGATQTVNALVIGGTSPTVNSGGVLTITSGALLNVASTASAFNSAIDFGTAEGVIQSPGNMIIGGAIAGSGGVTRLGSGSVTFFSANSSYTGTTILGGGTTAFAQNVPASGTGPFGSSTSPVVIAPAGFGTGLTTARLTYNGTGTGTFGRDLLVSGRIQTANGAVIPGIGAVGGNAAVYTGDIVLDDSPLGILGGANSTVRIDGDISGTGGLFDGATTVLLTGNNTYSGDNEFGSTVFLLGTDSPFGTGRIKMVHTGGAGPTMTAFGGPRTVANDVVYPALIAATYWTIGGSNDLTFTGDMNLSGGPYNHAINNTALTTYTGVLHTGGLNKTGPGTLVLSGNNVYNGNTNVNAGVLRVTSATGLGTPQAATSVASGATLELTNNALTSEPVTMNGAGVGSAGAVRSTSGNNSLGDATLATASTVGVDAGNLSLGNVLGAAALTKVGAGQLNVNRYRAGDMNVNVGTVAVTLGNNPGPKTSTMGALILAGGATPTSALDLGDNDMISTASSVADLTAKVAYARNGGLWDRPGLTSSAARASLYHLKTLGVMSGADYTSVGGAGLFDGLPYVATDSLVKYTTLGDANFSGGIDPGDYTRIDNGFGGGMTGWVNGDFDGSGAIDFLDYVWIDLSFNVQDGTLQRAVDFLNGDTTSPGLGSPSVSQVVNHNSQFGAPYRDAFLAAVPEPVAFGGWLTLAWASITAGRSRRCCPAQV